MTTADFAATASDGAAPVERLIRRLRLEAGDQTNTFIGSSGQSGMNQAGRLFGGLVAAQTIMAAGLTVPEREIHAVQQVFLRGGTADAPIQYRVTPMFAGRTYASVNVVATQHDHVISQAQVGLSAGIDGPDRADPVPSVVPDIANTVNRAEYRGHATWQAEPIEFRIVAERQDSAEPRLEAWFRPTGDVPDEPLIHKALVGFASDRALMSVAMKPHRDAGNVKGATLNHTIWFHRTVRLDNWHSYAMQSPSLADGRGMIHGAIHDESGRHIASTAQEGTLRFL